MSDNLKSVQKSKFNFDNSKIEIKCKNLDAAWSINQIQWEVSYIKGFRPREMLE